MKKSQKYIGVLPIPRLGDFDLITVTVTLRYVTVTGTGTLVMLPDQFRAIRLKNSDFFLISYIFFEAIKIYIIHSW